MSNRGLHTQNIDLICHYVSPQTPHRLTPHFLHFVLSSSLSVPSAMALFAAMSYTPLSLSLSRLRPPTNHRRFSPCLASVSSSSHESSPPPPPPSPPTETILSSNPPSKPLVESSRPLNSTYNYALPDPKVSPIVRFVRYSESSIERVISRTILFS